MNIAATTRGPWSTAFVPPFFDPMNAGKSGYQPNKQKIFDEAQGIVKRVRPAAKDPKKVHLLLIDMQKDFCFPDGTLYVGGRSGKGAIDDSARTAEFIYRNLEEVTKISTTLDTHVPFQIFFPSFWHKADGSPVAPHTVITVADLDAGTYVVSPQASAALGIDYVWLSKYSRYYCGELEKVGKYQLYIWPFHCELGTPGHTLVGVIDEAVRYHGYVRGTSLGQEIKGGNPLTENYSVLSPEVLSRHDGGTIAQKNVRFIQTLLDSDRVIIAGQAASHCVKSTIDDLLGEIVSKDPTLARKVYVMADCMSAVAVPDGKGGFIADFTPQAEDALRRFEAAGMHVVRSTDPVDSWPDFK